MANRKRAQPAPALDFSLGPPGGGRRVGRLDNLDRVRRETARLYQDARRGDVDAADASRLGSLLSLLAAMLRDREAEQLAARLDKAEGELAAVLAAQGTARWAA